MINRIAFFNRLTSNQLYQKTLTQHVEGMNAILDEWESKPELYLDKRWLAYMLATAYHETGKQMTPVEEIGKGKGRAYGEKMKQNKTPYQTPDHIYYGRGHVQLTWLENYERFGKILGVDLLNNPALALDMKISIKIMFAGMTKGYFTGVNLARYFNAEREDWISARKIINGNDKADLIALYGQRFHECVK